MKRIFSILILCCWTLSSLYSTTDLKVIAGENSFIQPEIHKNSDGKLPIHYQLYSEIEFESEFQKSNGLIPSFSAAEHLKISHIDYRIFQPYTLSYFNFLFSYPLHVPVFLKNRIILI
ncbi:MAG: hypothetical protein N2167_05265 [Flavobacteriales bacterium]|nr:hypothetical protein [Flavobacteriales bacterium]